MTIGEHSYVNAEYQGLELGLRHADLAHYVALAAQWTRAYQTAVPNDQLTDLDIVQPLTSYAATLETVHTGLAAAVAGVTAAPPSPNSGSPQHMPQPRTQAHFPSEVEAVQYLVGLEPRSRYRVTHQDRWRNSLTHAEDYLASRDDVDTPELQLKLSWYTTVVQELLEAAYTAMRDAYADAVVADVYRKVPASTLPHIIASRLKMLTCMGFDEYNCEPLLRRIGETFPEAVTECSAMPHKWQPTLRRS